MRPRKPRTHTMNTQSKSANKIAPSNLTCAACLIGRECLRSRSRAHTHTRARTHFWHKHNTRDKRCGTFHFAPSAFSPAGAVAAAG